MKHRVLMLGTSLNSHGGIAQVERAIINHWTESRYNIDHLTTHEDASRLRKMQIFIRSVFAFLAHALRHKSKIAHVHFFIHASILRESAFVVIAKVMGIRVLLHSHTGEFEMYLKTLNWFVRNYVRFSFSLADGLIIVSSNDKDMYTKYCRHANPIVLRNLVGIPLEQAGLESQRIITVGSLSQRKGTFDLLRAIPLVLRQFPSATFLLVGDGDTKHANAIAEEAGLTESVSVAGWLNRDKVNEAYLSSSIFVLPSYLKECLWRFWRLCPLDYR